MYFLLIIQKLSKNIVYSLGCLYFGSRCTYFACINKYNLQNVLSLYLTLRPIASLIVTILFLNLNPSASFSPSCVSHILGT